MGYPIDSVMTIDVLSDRTIRRRARAITQRLGLALILLLFLTSCVPILSMETEVTLGQAEAWEASIVLLLAPESQYYVTAFTTTLNEWVSKMQQAGIEASWRFPEVDKDGNQPCLIEVKGQGYELLNREVLEQNAVTIIEIDGKRHISFSYRAGASNFGLVPNQVFTLHGGRIISSNGERVNSGTVRWVNPKTQMEAVLTETPAVSWFWYFLLSLALVAGGTYALRRFQRTPQLQTPQTYPVVFAQPASQGVVRFCNQCGVQLPANASFCPSCGAKRL